MATGTAVEAALAAIDVDGIETTLAELVAIPSLSTRETPAQEHVAEWLTRAGLTVDQWDFRPDDLATSHWYSTEFDRDRARGVVGSYGGGAGARLLLVGHVDVVPPGRDADWTSAPFTPSVRDGRLYGRGACDMKGGLTAQLHAVAAIVRSGIELAGDVLVAPVIGEEDGGCGTLALLEHGVTADAAIISEPTQLAVVPAVAGALSFDIEVQGVSAHGCLREEGVSAIEHMMPVQRALIALEAARNGRRADELFGWLDRPFAICAGRIEGGDWASSEADWCRITGRYGVAPDEDLATARAEFESAVVQASRDDAWLSQHPPTVRWSGGQFYPARTDLRDPVVRSITAAHRAEAGAVEVRGMPYGCDMGITVGRGAIPTVVYGPGDIRHAHAPDEHVLLDDVVTCTRALVRTIVDRCAPATV